MQCNYFFIHNTSKNMQLSKVVTYREIMTVYGMNKTQAQHKLGIIRSVLGKKGINSVLIAEFCKAENVEQSIFEDELRKEIEKFTAKNMGKKL